MNKYLQKGILYKQLLALVKVHIEIFLLLLLVLCLLKLLSNLYQSSKIKYYNFLKTLNTHIHVCFMCMYVRTCANACIHIHIHVYSHVSSCMLILILIPGIYVLAEHQKIHVR